MNQNYIQPDPWSIIEEGFDRSRVKSSESLFSLGNGAMGQRANFEEDYSGPTFQGSYIAGVYYPDKTRVGWWKNGYPEYFAKVLNAPNWIGIRVKVDDEVLDLNTCTSVDSFRRVLNMREGWYERSFVATLSNGAEVAVKSVRLLSLVADELGAISYEISPVNREVALEVTPYLDAGITNEDSNWDDKFWDISDRITKDRSGYIRSRTEKTNFEVCTFMQAQPYLNGTPLQAQPKSDLTKTTVSHTYTQAVPQGDTYTLVKWGGYTVSTNHATEALVQAAEQLLTEATAKGYEALKEEQAAAWADIWKMADITIEGDVQAQQGIRFNIFQLNQTYLGKDARLNIGPKGFTGEKYGGSTYWDTEAYCLPFYMATKNQEVARNLLAYRYYHLDKAIENAEKLGFSGGAALYPMVTMNGEECHNEWEITFEEIHRNGAMSFAIYNYMRYTGDQQYVIDMGLEVLIGVARFWHQRANFSKDRDGYVILGVTGPNEYENNINNNWYTNYLAKWCIEFACEQWEAVRAADPAASERIDQITNLTQQEMQDWKQVAEGLVMPYSETHQVYLQQDGFLDKELIPVSELSAEDRPINQKWSWDRILRSPYIKQADVLQGFYFFEDHFDTQTLERNFDFYEPLTVHESSLSPCVHSILAAKLGRMEQAYEFYVRTSRLDLDDYNKEVEEGCHITSMAGTWMSIVEGFGGMRMKEGRLSFEPQIPGPWESYSFKMNFRGQILTVRVRKSGCEFHLEGDQPLEIKVKNQIVTLTPNEQVAIDI